MWRTTAGGGSVERYAKEPVRVYNQVPDL